MLSLRELREHERLFIGDKIGMPLYIVTYAVGNTPRGDKVEADEFRWISSEQVVFIKAGKVIAQFANVASVVDSQQLRKGESAKPLNYA